MLLLVHARAVFVLEPRVLVNILNRGPVIPRPSWWIRMLWIVVRVLRRRRPSVVADSSSTAAALSLCSCRNHGRRDVLAWTSTLSQPGKNCCHLSFHPFRHVKRGLAETSSLTQPVKFFGD